MGCPQCQSDEISPDGVCNSCGFTIGEQAEPPSRAAEVNAGDLSGMIEIAYSEGAEEDVSAEAPSVGEPSRADGIPSWRQELSQRLQAVREKRNAAAAAAAPASSPLPNPAEIPAPISPGLLERKPVRRPQTPRSPLPRQIALQPLEPKPEEVGPGSGSKDDARKIIDDVVSMRFPARGGDAATSISFEPAPRDEDEGKLILLSRTLSGMIDLIIVTLCAGGAIIAADSVEGIVAADWISAINYSLLFLINYFLYSLFFLSTSTQTIGMMITELRVVGPGGGHPTLGRLSLRCVEYLASLALLGIGLIMGLFDRDCMCFHDRHSGTTVVRV